MDLSVVIPSRGRAESLREVLVALTAQTLPNDRFQIIVTVDGPGEGERAMVRALDRRGRIRVIDGPPDGPGVARNRALPLVESPMVLFLNDDTVPDADLVAQHVDAHRRRVRGAGPAMVLGSAPWRVGQPDRVLDWLVRETSMVFFFDQMTGERARNPDFDWGFRHAWTLNLSMPTECLRRAGGFSPRLRHPVYEDVELAHRLTTAQGMSVRYRPEARVTHDHRYTVQALVRREVVLGHQAVELARANPACALAIFGFLHTEPSRIALARARAESGAMEATEAMASFVDVSDRPADSVSAACIEDLFEGLWKPVRAHLRTLGWMSAVDGLSAREAMDSSAQWVPVRGLSHAA